MTPRAVLLIGAASATTSSRSTVSMSTIAPWSRPPRWILLTLRGTPMSCASAWGGLIRPGIVPRRPRSIASRAAARDRLSAGSPLRFHSLSELDGARPAGGRGEEPCGPSACGSSTTERLTAGLASRRFCSTRREVARRRARLTLPGAFLLTQRDSTRHFAVLALRHDDGAVP